ncbi:hypothetical protein WMY93_011852 [Mugilogobius chulae]|uniref:C2H2-type domain-containing protein n=1 Tax=Mugilogobius chulae TaxID=88201 RepID=A0AAW0P6Y0_9GOBI
MRELRALVQERLTAAAEDIFALFERTIAEFEEELRREKEKQSKHDSSVQIPSLSLAGVQMPSLSPGLDLNQIKEEPEEQSVKQEEEQLPEACFTQNLFHSEPVSLRACFTQSLFHSEPVSLRACSAPGRASFHHSCRYNLFTCFFTSSFPAASSQHIELCIQIIPAYSEVQKQATVLLLVIELLENACPDSKVTCVRTEESGSVCVKTEDTRADPHLQTEGDTQLTFDSNQDAPFSCSEAQMETEVEGDRSSAGADLCSGDRPEISASVNTSGTAEGAEDRKYQCTFCFQMSLLSPAGVQMSLSSLAGVQMSRLSPGLGLNQIKEESEEQSVKQEEEQLPDDVPKSSAVCERAPFSCSAAQTETEAGDRSSSAPNSGLSPKYKSEAESGGGVQMSSKSPAGVQMSSTSPAVVQMSKLNPGLGLNQIKEEPEEQSVKQEEEQLPVVCVKTEEETQGQDISAEPNLHSDTEGDTEHSSDADEDWRAPFSCSDAQTKGRDVKKFQCYVCRKTFGKKEHLQLHMRVHTGERPFSCPTCDKAFSIKGTLDKHMRTHTGEKPYSCSACKKTFSQKSTLDKHTRTHTGEKPYSCSTCDRTFADRSTLRTHVKTHTGEKPYSCSFCMKGFIKRGELDRHVRIHTGEKPFSCSVCNKSFAHCVTLQRHMRSHTGERPYSCSEPNRLVPRLRQEPGAIGDRAAQLLNQRFVSSAQEFGDRNGTYSREVWSLQRSTRT